MNMSEVLERGYKIGIYGKIIDDYGNEYRNEEGEVEYLEEDDKV